MTSRERAPRVHDRGLFIGRFQPFHHGHLEAIKRLAQQHDEVIVGIGSANVSHTAANPFTAGERLEMISAALRDARVANVLTVPIPDVGRNAIWVAHVTSLVPAFSVVHTNNPLAARLFGEAGHKVAPVPFNDREHYEGTRIRAAIAGDDASWRDRVPKPVADIVVRIDGPARLRDLARASKESIVEGSG